MADNTELKKFIEDYIQRIEKHHLMYAFNLDGIEAVWHILMMFEAFTDGENSEDKLCWYLAYEQIADKYKCGSLGLSGKVLKEHGEQNSIQAADRLIRRLQEVRLLKYRLKFLSLLRNKEKTNGSA